MSLIGVRSAPFLLTDYCSSIRSLSVSSSLSDVASSSYDPSSDTLNLEDLKIQLGQKCLSCGVCWGANEFSFDCKECGGYSMNKPCPKCDGSCSMWTRDFSMVSNLLFTLSIDYVTFYFPQHNLINRVTRMVLQNGMAVASIF